MYSGVLFGLTVLLGHICVCSAINCYHCDYATSFSSSLNSNPNCNEGANFNGANLTAYGLTTQCSGQCVKVRAGVGSTLIINRNCYSPCASVHAAGEGTFCCNTDYCNEAWRMKATLVSAIVAGIAALLLRAA